MNSLPEDREPDTADVAAFKHAFRRHAAGVAIITASAPDHSPVGFTATSLASLAAVPPLATFNMARTASAWPTIAETDHVAIHMLGVRNRALAERMSREHSLRFTGDHWRRGPHRLPILNGVTSWMIARIVNRIPVHDSAVVVVQIEQGGTGADDAALLYHERDYLTPGDRV